MYSFSFLLSCIVAQGKNNIAFTALFELGDAERAIDLLIKTERIPEAAMLARTYAPERTSSIIKLWKADLESRNRKKIAESLADPADYANLFPELSQAAASPAPQAATPEVPSPAEETPAAAPADAPAADASEQLLVDTNDA